ncbi:MAG: hypothetical protein ABI222_16810 [Opitutaceae bacterium]
MFGGNGAIASALREAAASIRVAALYPPMNENTSRKTKVSLEDLLRLKRAEQPPAEFWAEFDRGLRTKQLAAIVEPRPWWAPFIRVGTRLARYQLPVGAMAVLAVTLLTVREYRPTTFASMEQAGPAEIASLTAPTAQSGKALATDLINISLAPAMSTAVSESVPVSVAVESRSIQPALNQSTALGSSSHVAMVSSELSSARYMADSLAAAHATNPELNQLLGQSLPGNDGNAIRSEPLAQINVPGESRRSRFLGGTAWLASASTGSSALQPNEQATRHLTERRLSESDVISRIDMDGSRLTVKF